MPTRHRVEQGECLSSIAEQHGWFWKSLWDHPDNAGLRQRRQDPNILYPGDVVVIPDKQEKDCPGATAQTHRFNLKGVPCNLRVRLLENDVPIANRSYELEVDGRVVARARTDGGGWLEQKIPPDARQGTLCVEGRDPYPLDLGSLDPIDERSGAQGRLRNLGFHAGELSGELDELTRWAIGAFQRKHSLRVTQDMDAATRQKLKAEYGC